MPDPVEIAVDALLPEPPEMSERAYADGLARLRAATSGRLVTTSPAAVRPIPRRRLLPLAAAAAAVAAVGTAVVLSRGNDGRVPIAHFTDLKLRPGQYLHVHVEAFTATTHQITELWVPADRHDEWQRIVRTEPADHGDGTAVGADGFFGQFDPLLLDGISRQRALDSLPRDPREILVYLQGFKHGSASPVGKIATLLTAPAPADARHALCELMAMIPGTIIDENGWSAGHRAVAFTNVMTPNNQITVYLSPENGQVVGLAGDVGPGGRYSSQTYTYAVVDGMGIRP
ncbi:hypothetical protein SAMN05421504_102302 [Amycolatopsis xylanica]|uniref:Uncharacterized protein n=1 Tax=Amycolatopsis xylanica TaxID=589385 RepID=A0A1H2YYV7_9PSEU|nr:hypothetical protein [Amycolatopsis xylanica]SDX09844.1 hypothetical protein SAMN05421504_102302 [Amycolatopsis xylanica]